MNNVISRLELYYEQDGLMEIYSEGEGMGTEVVINILWRGAKIMYRILLADDEGIMLESLKSIISSNYGNECEIHTAKTGRAVVEEAEKISAGHLFYGYPDAGVERNPGHPGDPEIQQICSVCDHHCLR